MKSKSIFILFLLINYFSLSAQLPVIYSIGGQGTAVDWAEIKRVDEADEDGPGFFYQDCAQGLWTIDASSTLASQGNKNYKIKNLTDNNPMTAWVEGVKGYGIGEWFEVKGITVNGIYNGYQSSPSNWKNNSRVRRFKVYVNGEPLCLLDLTDEMGQQQFKLPFEADWQTHAVFRFEIVDVYRGLKWDDVCISHIDHYGCCFAKGSNVLLSDGSEIMISEIEAGMQLSSFNIESSKLQITNTKRLYEQKHINLLEITAGKYEIKITPNHSLFVKDVGFVSLQTLKLNRAYKNLHQLENVVELLVYDAECKEFVYKKIDKINKHEGLFSTYTLKPGNNESFIVNGFVTRFE